MHQGSDAFEIRANGVPFRFLDAVMSPDSAAWDDAGVPGPWNLAINVIDFMASATAWHGGTGGASCHDYNHNGRMDVADFSVFGAVWGGGTRTCNP